MIKDWKNVFVCILLCCPVLVPQILGGVGPLGLVTENESVRHWVAVDTAFPLGLGYKHSVWKSQKKSHSYLLILTLPIKVLVTESVMVDGPAITKELKSNRNCNISTVLRIRIQKNILDYILGKHWDHIYIFWPDMHHPILSRKIQNTCNFRS